jgi:hypothetical protein
MPLSRVGSEAWKKAGGKGKREFFIFFVENYEMATFLLHFYHSTNDLNENKNEEDVIYTSVCFSKDSDHRCCAIGSLSTILGYEG